MQTKAHSTRRRKNSSSPPAPPAAQENHMNPSTTTTTPTKDDNGYLTHQQQMALLQAPGISMIPEQRLEALRSMGEISSTVEQGEGLLHASKEREALAKEQVTVDEAEEGGSDM
ncbi:MAG: hypothetical protein Q9191_008554, partial [Dirinaria sp. TL-2023a]